MARAPQLLIYTGPTAARILGVSRQTIWRWLNDGTLDEVPSEGRVRLALAASVEKLKRERESLAAKARRGES